MFFRDQQLDPDQFLAFARRIGEPVEYPFVQGIDGYPEIIAVTKLPHETVNFGGIWHSDTVYLERPPMATMLVAREVPPPAATRCSPACTPRTTRSRPGCSSVLVQSACVNSSALADVRRPGKTASATAAATTTTEYVAEHPVIRTHPETGRKALYVNVAHTARFVGHDRGGEPAAAAVPLRALGAPEFTCRFQLAGRVRSRCGTTACAMHNPINDYHGYTRRMHRITLAGDVPV